MKLEIDNCLRFSEFSSICNEERTIFFPGFLIIQLLSKNLDSSFQTFFSQCSSIFLSLRRRSITCFKRFVQNIIIGIRTERFYNCFPGSISIYWTRSDSTVINHGFNNTISVTFQHFSFNRKTKFPRSIRFFQSHSQIPNPISQRNSFQEYAFNPQTSFINMSVFSRIAKNNRIIVVIIKPTMIYKITYIKPFLNQNLTLTIFIRGGGIPTNNSLTFFFTLYDIYLSINKKIKFIFHPLTPFLNPTNSEKNI